MTFKDHFSGHAGDYSRYRPVYPDTLFEWLAAIAPACDTAWDCGSGNGQAARGLAPHFREVCATDASEQQIAAAHGPGNVRFRVATAEDSGLPDASVDLVCVAQAVHWFDLPRFYAEVRRVTRPGGVIAVWTYTLQMTPAEIAVPVRRFAHDTVGRYWPDERAWVDDAYRSLDFPFGEIDAPAFRMHAQWSLADLIGYVSTWSAVRRCRARTGTDPIPALATELAAVWGDPGASRELSWPLAIRVGRVAPSRPAERPSRPGIMRG